VTNLQESNFQNFATFKAVRSQAVINRAFKDQD